MQNSYYQLKKYWSIIVILLFIPLLLYVTISILPTHDDWASLTKPDFNPFFIKERFLFYGYHWRPFDSILGYIVGRNPQFLFPTLNHILVVFGHLACTILIYKIIHVLGFDRLTCNIATIFFFIIPSTMATVLAVDSQNQVYSLMWGIIAFLYYVKFNKNKILWVIFIFIATLSKENGLIWALICPILAYGFDFINLQILKRDLMLSIGIVIVYALAIILLPKDITIHPEYIPDSMKIVKNTIKFIFTTFITIDYIYLLHEPSRNLFLAGLSFLLTIPFMYFVYIKNIKKFAEKKIICTIICLFIAVGPHLLTVYSMMHTYAGLVMLTIIVAYAIQNYRQHIKYITISFVLFLISAITIDAHLINESIKSGLVGKMMAKDAIKKTNKPIDNVYVIIIEDDYPKLSSFCVIPNEAFGWGLASQYETNYQWPKIIKDTTIERSKDAIKKAHELGLETLKKQSYDCIWIVNHKNIEVINK